MSFERIENETPMAVHAEVLDDRSGREVLTVIAKVTWAVDAAGEASIAVPGAEVREMDVWTGEPYASSLRYPSDLWPEKPGTDVLLLGAARPPAERAATAHDVRLRIETARGVVQKSARVHGPRVYSPGQTGIVPAELGPIPPQWAPRCNLAGTYDDAWRRERAPLPPVDRDPRYASCASPGLWIEEPLRGDELIEVTGATPLGLWRFRLPFYHPVFSYRVRGALLSCPTHLDTLLVDADVGQVELTFRTSIPAPRKLQTIELVRVVGSAGLSEDLITAARLRAAALEEDEAR